VELSPARARALEDRVAELGNYNLEVEPFGTGAFAIKQVPTALAHVDLEGLLQDLADDIAEGGPGTPLHDRMELILATMACHASIRAGDPLSSFQVTELLAALDEVDFSVCAHGRPVSIRVTPGELERRFHRS
jgi:DNA mismatch repair protein MutL